MTAEKMRHPALMFNNVAIRDRGEALSLTDMWKAAGSPSGRGPADWLALASTIEFVEHVALIAGNSGNKLVEAKAGRYGGTVAHWQIALAYAKYLSPEFHVWCNTVVRERMEGRLVAADPNEIDIRTNGIARKTIHKVTNLEKALATLSSVVAEQSEQIRVMIIANDPRVAAVEYVSVRQLLDDAKAMTKGRNSLNRKIGRRLRDQIAVRSDIHARRCPHSRVWLYPIDFANAWMAEHGGALVEDHNARVSGQGVIQFPRRKSRKLSSDQSGVSA